MKYMQFLGVGQNTNQQAYFKDGVELVYPDMSKALRIVILPAFSGTGNPVDWVPAVRGQDESDFYTMLMAAKFVGHGNRRAKTAFLSPRTFDPNAIDPYDAFYDYCSRSDKWSYLTKDRRGKRLTGEVEGAIIPRMKKMFVANVIDMSVGTRGGVFLTELSESAAKSILYTFRKNGARVDGIAFERDGNGRLVFGDITSPESALVIEVAWGGKGYVARPAVNEKGELMRMEIPITLLQHRQHMEEPGTFLIHPGTPQDIVNRLAGLLRGYKSDDGTDEIEALKEAMEFAYGKDAFVIDEDATEDDPFDKAAKAVMSAEPGKKAEAVNAAVERGVKREAYTPTNEEKKLTEPAKRTSKPPVVGEAPGETVDPSDIKAMREMLRGGKV